VVGVGEDLRGVAVLEQQPEMEERGLLADAGGLLHRVGDDHHRIARAQLVDQFLDLGRGDRVERRAFLRVLSPDSDAGVAFLNLPPNLWNYQPESERTQRIPASAFGEPWMGSDFSNKDIARSTEIIDQYDHELTAQEEIGGHMFYTITSIPHVDAAVVWGKEVLIIRDDFVLMEQQFWDQDGELVKSMKTLEVKEMGGRAVGSIMRMTQADEPEEWTEVITRSIQFNVDLPANTFTLSNLRNPRQ